MARKAGFFFRARPRVRAEFFVAIDPEGPPLPISWLPLFGSFLHRGHWRRCAGVPRVAKNKERRAVDSAFVRVRASARSVFVTMNARRPPASASWLPPFETFFTAAALGGTGAGIPRVG